MLIDLIFEKFVQIGTLHVIDCTGKKYTFKGTGDPECTIRLHNTKIVYKLLWNADLALGEGYTNGDLTIEQGTLSDFLNLCTRNEALRQEKGTRHIKESLLLPLAYLRQTNTQNKSKQRVAHHYDLNGELYKLFLDADMQYSCAYFADPQNDLETAQLDKKRHLAAKLHLAPGQKILDIGSGWGGLALYLAQQEEVEVTGITLSEEQLKVSTMRAKKLGLSDRVHFKLTDYREEKGRYDRIVSVGMFEHVGVPYYKQFFNQVYELLNDDGIAVLAAIGRRNNLFVNSRSWIGKYIFPGGYCPAVSEVLKPIERSKLYVTDIEILRHHYAYTLNHWHNRFQSHRDTVKKMYDENFCRMWEYYLKGCEMAFRNLGYLVFQIQLIRNEASSPLTRDYIFEWEQEDKVANDAEDRKTLIANR